MNLRRTMAEIFLPSVLAANTLMLVLFASTFFEERNLPEQDYLGYYTAAKLPRTEIYDINRQRAVQTSLLGQPYGVPAGVLLFNHPPPLVPIVKLLVTDDYFESYYRWAMVLSVVCLLCAWVVYLLLRDAGLTIAVSACAAFTALLFYPLYRSVEIGTDTPVVVLGVLLWTFFLLRNVNQWAGLALGLTLVKPQLTIVLAAATFACSRRAFLWFVIGAVVLAVGSVLYVGEKGTLNLIENIRLSSNGESFGVFFTRQYNLMGLLARFGLAKKFVVLIGWIALLAAAAYFAYKRRCLTETWIAFSVLLALFCSPNLHFHDLALLLIPMTVIGRRIRSLYTPLVFLPLSAIAILGAGLTVSAYFLEAAAAVALSGTELVRAKSTSTGLTHNSLSHRTRT